MFRLINRLFVLIGGIFNQQVRELEWKSPDAVLSKSLERKKTALDNFYSSVASMKANRVKRKNALEEKQKKIERLEVQIMHAKKINDREKGTVLFMKRNQLLIMIQEDVAKLHEGEKELNMAKQQLSLAQRAVEKMEEDKESMIANIKLMQSQRDIKAITQTFFDDKDMHAYKSLETRLSQEKMKTSLIDEIAGNDVMIDDSDYLLAQEEFDMLVKNNALPLPQKQIGTSVPSARS